MGRSKPIDLGIIKFQSSGDATLHFRAMLHRYRIGDVVNTSDSAELRELLKRHPEYEQKVGSGIERFEVMAAEYETQCFKIIRTDKSSERFSYPTCISGKGRSQ